MQIFGFAQKICFRILASTYVFNNYIFSFVYIVRQTTPAIENSLQIRNGFPRCWLKIYFWVNKNHKVMRSAVLGLYTMFSSQHIKLDWVNNYTCYIRGSWRILFYGYLRTMESPQKQKNSLTNIPHLASEPFK